MTHVRRGDTIVEVLVAISVLAMALMAAFVATKSAMHAVRDGQEHSEALMLATAQLEKIRYLNDADRGKLYDGDMEGFCIDNDLAKKSGDDCKNIGADGMHMAGGFTGTPYEITVDDFSSTGLSPKIETFAVEITWDSVTGHEQASIKQYVKLINDDGTL